jgi:hypothetical protein
MEYMFIRPIVFAGLNIPQWKGYIAFIALPELGDRTGKELIFL